MVLSATGVRRSELGRPTGSFVIRFRRQFTSKTLKEPIRQCKSNRRFSLAFQLLARSLEATAQRNSQNGRFSTAPRVLEFFGLVIAIAEHVLYHSSTKRCHLNLSERVVQHPLSGCWPSLRGRALSLKGLSS
jgi:hypothetical protein